MIKRIVSKKPAYSALAKTIVALEFTCPGCARTQAVTISDPTLIGGCSGHPEGDYCYCSTPHYEEKVECKKCGASVELQGGY